MKRILGLCIINLIIISGKPHLSGQNKYIDEIRSGPLKGLSEVFVIVLIKDGDARALEMMRESIRSAVELRLRREGIVVIKDDPPPPGTPVFGPIIQDLGRTIVIELCLSESVILARDHTVKTIVTTWKATDERMKNTTSLMEVLYGQLDMFLNDFYIANPKKFPNKMEFKER